MKYRIKEDKIGEIVLNGQGTPMKLIEYRGMFDVDVEFQDEYKHIVEHAVYNNFKQGKIKNPYNKTVYGVGMLGAGKYKARYYHEGMSDDYRCWQNILERCYQNNGKHLSYYDVSVVCEEWLNFQNFAKWYEENWYEIPNKERLQIDKDILSYGNKLYSPETCLLVPQSINLLFTNATREDGLPNGIRRTKNGKKFQAMYNKEHLGCFETLKEAYFNYSIKKEATIKRMADEYKKYIPANVYEALYNYRVLIENDKNYSN